MSGSNGSARDTLDELIDEREESEMPLDPDERLLVANILELRNLTIYDVMVPRADIVAIPITAPLQEVIEVATREGHSRLPIYSETLDDAQGMVHIKDVLGWRGRDNEFSLEKVQRRLLFVAPSMRVLELLLEMRVKRSHMALVVDEFGGVDGLVTIEDLVEEIVGEIDDEHDNDDEPKMEHRRDGSWVADARIELKTFEERIGRTFSNEDHEDIDTLGGLVFSIAGRVPIRGEIVSLSDGTEFEILDADPRRIHRVRIRTGAPQGDPSDSPGAA
ncbi:MAG: HlyC/CorC family transporter [Rhodospirillales bacterium]|nr:HlyC/CorC family transporter [Rhodospirillales bacterium]